MNLKKIYSALLNQSTKKIFRQSLLVFVLALFSTGCLNHYKRRAVKDFQHCVKNQQTFDVIIVPGIPYTGARWGHLMKSRVVWSWALYKNGIAKNVIYSGGAVHTPYQEARVMGLYAEKLGIPKENIYYDTCAKHSTENVYYSYQLAKKMGFHSVAVASDVYQCFFLRNFIRRKFSNKIVQLPVIPDTLAGYSKLELMIDPSPAMIQDYESFIPLTEKEGYFKRLRGTFGWDINWKKEAVIVQ